MILGEITGSHTTLVLHSLTPYTFSFPFSLPWEKAFINRVVTQLRYLYWGILRPARGMAVWQIVLFQNRNRLLTEFRTRRSRIGLMPPVNSNGRNLNSVISYRGRQVQSFLQRKDDTIYTSHMPVLGVSISHELTSRESTLNYLSPSHAHRPQIEGARGCRPLHLSTLGNGRER